jgi:hypothetical protein
MQFVLVIMFFVTPPTLGSNRSWALQSTQSIEFENWEACDDTIKNVILPAVKSTDTMALTAWCLPKSSKGEARLKFFKEQDAKGGFKALSTEDRNNKKVQFGSCYDYVPPPVGQRKPTSERHVATGVVGECHSK